MALKDFLDSHPATILAGVGVAVASTTVGVTNYVTGQQIENEKIKIEIAYKSDIASLKARLVSIERKIGVDEKSYFDVSRLILTPDRVRELDPTYKNMAAGAFFVVEPNMHHWKYSLTSEFELMKATLSDSGSKPVMGSFANALGKSNLHLWRGDEAFVIHAHPKKGFEAIAPKQISFFPYVTVQVIGVEEYMEILSDAVGQDDSKLPTTLERLDALGKNSDTQLTDMENVLATSPPETSGALDSKAVDASLSNPAEFGAKVERAGETKLEAEELLADLFRADLAGFLLAGVVHQTFFFPQMLSGSQSVLNTVQKKGNVLYVQSRLEFKSIEIEGRAGETPFFVDREVFLVTNPKALAFVTVQVPSVDGRSEAFSWVGQRLSGFRVPLGPR